MEVTVTTAPLGYPVTRDELKAHLRVDFSDDDATIDLLIQVATTQCELWTGRAFYERTVTVTYPAVCREQRLVVPLAPLKSVAAISYQVDGVATALDAEDWDAVPRASWFGTVVPALGGAWPAMDEVDEAISLTGVVVGYGDAAAVPAPIKHAIMMYAGHLYEHREATTMLVGLKDTPMGINALLAPYRVVQHGGWVSAR